MIIVAHSVSETVGGNYNTRSEMLSCISKLTPEDTLTFDGIYENIWNNQDIIRVALAKKIKVILFIMGASVGGNNKFDGHEMPFERFADWNKIVDLAIMGCKIGWHTWRHFNLTTLGDNILRYELTPPFPMEYVAYPYGFVDDRVANMAKELGFKAGYSVNQGDNTAFKLNRKFIKEQYNV